MLRILIAAALVILSTSAFAQSIQEVKGIRVGVGCVDPVSTVATRLTTCNIGNAKARIWCPNGKIFDRTTDHSLSKSVTLSICQLNQVL